MVDWLSFFFFRPRRQSFFLEHCMKVKVNGYEYSNDLHFFFRDKKNYMNYLNYSVN